MNKSEQKKLLRILVSSLILTFSAIIHPSGIYLFLAYLIAYLIVGYDVILKSLKKILKGKFLDENFLMSIATIGAFLIGEYLEAVLVMLLYQIGELFQLLAVGKSRKSIAALMDIRPDYANLKKEGKLLKVSPEEVHINDFIVVKPGEKVPLDGIILEGTGYLDKKALTGESLPIAVKKDDEVLSGSINTSGVLTIKVTKEYTESTVSKILDLVENASSKKASSENFITKFAKYYTPIVVILALCLAILPPLLGSNLTFLESIKRALTFLVISCPCAFVISVPLSFFGGLGGASKKGILIKGSNYLEALSEVKTIVFDKTGTLTKGVFTITKIHSKKEKEMLELARLAEEYSNHPIAISIKEYFKEDVDRKRVTKIKELAGLGIDALIDNEHVFVGNESLMKQEKIAYVKTEEVGTVVHVGKKDEYFGYLVIADEIKKTTQEALNSLNNFNLVMLTGDNEYIASKIAKELGMNEYYAGLLPTDKVSKIEEILQNSHQKVAFVGDGINDAPVISRADIGIAMGGVGSDAAIESADIVIMDDDLRKIEYAIAISKRTLRIVKENIFFAIGIKILFLILGACGISNMMGSVFADVGVSILAIINAMRSLKVK